MSLRLLGLGNGRERKWLICDIAQVRNNADLWTHDLVDYVGIQYERDHTDRLGHPSFSLSSADGTVHPRPA